MRNALLLVAVLATPCTAQELQRVPSIQEQIANVAGALRQGGSAPMHLNVAAIRELNALNESVSDKHEIVKQVAIFSTGPGEERPMVALAIMHLFDLPPKIVIRVLAPHLEADDPKLRSFVRDWFQGHDNGGPDVPLKPVNFEDYVDYVRAMVNMKQDVPAAFVEYIYGRSPGRALIVFYHAHRQRDAVTALQAEARALEAARRELENPDAPVARQPAEEPQSPENREVLLAAHNVENAIWFKQYKFDEEFQQALPGAKEQLAKLSEHKEWWVRLYVAEIMRRHSELRLAEVVEKLSTDGNALVSKTAKAAKG